MSKYVIRSIPTKFETRDSDNGEKIIEGYFAVFCPDAVYEIGPGMTESVDPAAFDERLGADHRQ